MSESSSPTQARNIEAVFVTNISYKANTKTVSDFFSFCGKIIDLVLREDAARSAQEGIVVFETESAAKTALLLTNALIVDKVIQVVPYNASIHGPVDSSNRTVSSPQSADAISVNSDSSSNLGGEHNPAVNLSKDSITNREHTVPDSERTKTSVIASMLAAGYTLGQEAIHKARQVDEENNISNKIKGGAESIKATASEIDQKLHISEGASAIKTAVVEKAKEMHIGENATAVKTAVVEKAKAVDERFQISGMFKSATDMISQQMSTLAAKAQENPTVSKGVDMVSSLGTGIKQTATNISQSVENQFTSISEESSRLIEEKKKEKYDADFEMKPTEPSHNEDAEIESLIQEHLNEPTNEQ
ncbi:hypothetical protein SAMD00019534_028400 [Acytostelium subglobosum LB1]|uniref:hypothetical protein n=1 Tax=Acytostelium subglobosum LB1 TaxID=1410327 RepID=UPI000644BF0A|nr:hypothetical protein SAMD00019534_028400 [Acytostelium subglobosum LB1]GAM19665.1 hypothetical protein SAMD00019534_028400 [Acytostelium subglobosum LB1]|eukprot:XP_012756427.1 hypothetical protein SAMD00019534_028400 [Acytostelium subglobosum LB1]